MNRCAICDVTDEDNPKAGISLYPEGDSEGYSEARCLECHNNIQENLEDLSIADEDFEFSDSPYKGRDGE